jgi:hypothetical protein
MVAGGKIASELPAISCCRLVGPNELSFGWMTQSGSRVFYNACDVHFRIRTSPQGLQLVVSFRLRRCSCRRRLHCLASAQRAGSEFIANAAKAGFSCDEIAASPLPYENTYGWVVEDAQRLSEPVR